MPEPACDGWVYATDPTGQISLAPAQTKSPDPLTSALPYGTMPLSNPNQEVLNVQADARR